MTTGRKKRFEDGATPLQHYAAWLLALGKKQNIVAKMCRMSREGVRKWQKFPYFQNLVEENKLEFAQKIREDGFDEIELLEKTALEGLKSTAHRSDALRAIENLLKIKGMYSPNVIDIKQKEAAQKLSEEELLKIAKQAAIGNYANLAANSDTGVEKTG